MDKPLSDKRQHFVREYCSNGHNASKAYKTAYPGCKNGYDAHGARLVGKDSIRQAIIEYEAKIELENVNSREYIDRQFKELVLDCRAKGDRVNLNRALENMAKNRGYYAADNAQQTEKTALDAEQQALYDDYLAYRRRLLLKQA